MTDNERKEIEKWNRLSKWFRVAESNGKFQVCDNTHVIAVCMTYQDAMIIAQGLTIAMDNIKIINLKG